MPLYLPTYLPTYASTRRHLIDCLLVCGAYAGPTLSLRLAYAWPGPVSHNNNRNEIRCAIHQVIHSYGVH